MTLEQQHDISYLSAFHIYGGFHRTAQSEDARIFSPCRRSSTKHLLAAFCGALLAIALTGCGVYSSSGKTYMPPPTTPNSSPALWVANRNNVLEFSSTALTTSGSSAAAPALVLNSSAFAQPKGVVFDTSGDLWVIDSGDYLAGPALLQFSSANLSTLQSQATATPDVTIRSSAFIFPQQAAFDSKGDLWVSDGGANAIFEFMPSQLMASGAAVTPSLTIESKPAFNRPLGMAFDSAGNLWVANNEGNTIFKFNAAALSVPSTLSFSGPLTINPSVMLSDDGKQSLVGPWALAFDNSGNLWASNAMYRVPNTSLGEAVDTVVQFSKASLAASGSPTPAVTLSSAMVGGNASLSNPRGIAFDNTGILSVASSDNFSGVALYGSSQLTAGGAVAPQELLVGAATDLSLPAGVTLGPTIVYGHAGTYSGNGTSY